MGWSALSRSTTFLVILFSSSSLGTLGATLSGKETGLIVHPVGRIKLKKPLAGTAGMTVYSLCLLATFKLTLVESRFAALPTAISTPHLSASTKSVHFRSWDSLFKRPAATAIFKWSRPTTAALIEKLLTSIQMSDWSSWRSKTLKKTWKWSLTRTERWAICATHGKSTKTLKPASTTCLSNSTGRITRFIMSSLLATMAPRIASLQETKLPFLTETSCSLSLWTAAPPRAFKVIKK